MLPKIVSQKIQENQPELLHTLETLIAFPSVAEPPQNQPHPYGDACADALDFMLKKATDFGLYTTNYAYHVGTADTHLSPAPVLGILSHLDVVPVMPENWQTPPFQAVLKDGRIYGRGAIDDKGPAVAALYALKSIHDAGISLKKPVRLLFGCNEENGSSDMEYYNAHAEMPPLVFTPDGQYPLIHIEKGMLRLRFSKKMTAPFLSVQAGTAPNAVPAQAVCTLPAEAAPKELPENGAVTVTEGVATVTMNGLAAHASTPETGINAITAMMQLFDFADCQALLTVFPHGCTDGSGLGIACADAESGALTCICSQLSMEEGMLCGTVDIRYPLCTTKEAVLEQVEKTFAAVGFACEALIVSDVHAVPEKSDFVQKLLKVYEEETGEKGECIAIGGGTYVHEIPGGVAFGAEFPGWDYHMHGDDEFIPVEHLMADVRMIAAAILEICNGEEPA